MTGQGGGSVPPGPPGPYGDGGPSEPRRPTPPGLALALCTAGFAAVIIAGLGVASLVLDEDVITTRGLGQIPGATGVLAAAGAFAAVLWPAVRTRHPSYWSAVWTAAAVYLAYLLGVGVAVLAVGAGPGVAFGVVARLATGWVGVVIVVAALVSAWCAVALVRTTARPPRWPWERE